MKLTLIQPSVGKMLTNHILNHGQWSQLLTLAGLTPKILKLN